MADETPPRPWTFDDECEAIREVSEERRLRNLGIDPDRMNSLEILLELKKRMAKIKKEEAEEEQD
jgi:hypothetical protein